MKVRSVNNHTVTHFINRKDTFNVLYVKLNHCPACEKGRPRFISVERTYADRDDIAFAEFTLEDANMAKLLTVKKVPAVRLYKDEELVYASHSLNGIADLDVFLASIDTRVCRKYVVVSS